MANVAQNIVETLHASGVRRMYGVPGDSLNGLTEALRTHGGIEWVHTRHEEAAAFAAGAQVELVAAHVDSGLLADLPAGITVTPIESTLDLQAAMATAAKISVLYPKIGLRLNTGMISEMMPKKGRAMM